MENKTTTELLEILRKKGTGSGDNYDEKVSEEAFAELRERAPFWEIFNEDYDESIPYLLRTVKELQEEIKLLKRHKHEPNTGDVMVRI